LIGKLALRSLTAHPLRSAVLAAGFGAGVGVMAILLGVAEIVLDQSRAPALVGGGDVVIRLGPQVPARLLLSGTLQSDALKRRVRVAAPGHTSALYLLHEGKTTRVAARGGIPSLERALGDNETAAIAAWRDVAADVEWTRDTPERVLREVDRFHPVPDAPAWASSWAEWLYFNGRGQNARFYMTVLVGPSQKDGRRAAGIRLQLDRNGKVENFTASQPISEADAMNAPELTIAGNSVKLDGLKYIVSLDLSGPRGERLRGTLSLEASPGRLVPPIEIAGARGWRSGYVVPVMSGRLDGALDVNGETISFAGGAGYHDHNWGFWQGVSWQWGQAQQGDLSLLYGRVFPPREAADPDRIPGFVGVLGPDGPLGYATNVTIKEENGSGGDSSGHPQTITITARSSVLDIHARFDVGSVVTTQGTIGSGLDFLQMRGTYTVTGRAGDRAVNFTAPGSAETFRGR
jgi:hypothetical protein